jgi:hypothetical protein
MTEKKTTKGEQDKLIEWYSQKQKLDQNWKENKPKIVKRLKRIQEDFGFWVEINEDNIDKITVEIKKLKIPSKV